MVTVPDLRENRSLMPVSELHGDRPLQEHYLDDVKGILIPYREIRERVDAIARQLHADYSHSNVLFVCLLNGAKTFSDELADSIRKQGLDLRYDPIDVPVESYKGTASTGNVRVDESKLVKVKSRLLEDRRISDVVLIEDIVDTGRTISRISRDIVAFRECPELTISICTLLDKVDSRLAEFESINESIKYTGFKIPKLFVIGFGLDYNNRYRDMHHIGIPTEEAIVKYGK